MADTQTVSSDMGIGLGVVFSLLALVGAGVMIAAPTQSLRAWGFAAAMIAAGLAVVGAQALWS